MNSLTWIAAACLGVAPPVPHFDTEILPILTRAGCNAGACHGAAAGRGEFKLSLFGGEPAADYEAIVQEFEGRRVDVLRPAAGLILRKGSGRLPHGGGEALVPDGPDARTIEAWMAAGAPRGGPRRLTRFEVFADPPSVERDHAEVRLRAIARFDDGPEVDVTARTVFAAADRESLMISAVGSGVCGIVRRRGRHDVTARFLDRVAGLTVTRPLGDVPVDLAGESTEQFIDAEIIRTLGELRLQPAGQADDATFLRRVRLDLTGTLPRPEELVEFASDPASDKRTRLIDRLLTGPEFVDLWTLRLARWLELRSSPGDPKGAEAYARRLRDAVRDGLPLDRLARELITATGDTHTVGFANFARSAADAEGAAELVGRIFLGARFECARCHNHPLDRWTLRDHRGLTAIFAGVRRDRVVTLGSGFVVDPHTGLPVAPRFPGGPVLPAADDPRREFAARLTSPEQPAFARALANRLWQAMFGRGLVEPVDDLRETLVPSHPRLLDLSAADLAGQGYDLRKFLRRIALSRAYGRAADPRDNSSQDIAWYDVAPRRKLLPEVWADAVSDVLDVPAVYPGRPPGTRAVRLVDPRSPAPDLDALGRCSATGCEAAGTGRSLATALHLLNGDALNARLLAPDGRLAKLIAARRSDAEIVTEFYLRGLARSPTPAESERVLARIAAVDPRERSACLADFVWALLNSRAFSTNR